MRDLTERPPPMSKPAETDGVVCPESYNKGKIHAPERVYEGTEHGKPVRRGILSSHRHRYQSEDCPWSGLPVPVVPRPPSKGKKDKYDARAEDTRKEGSMSQHRKA